MSEPRSINLAALWQLHAASLAEHGGRPGIWDQAALDSALVRPRNRFAYEPDRDLAALAASYSFGLTRNHPFHDGNKRVRLHAADLFALINGHEIVIEDEVDAICTILGLAAGDISEEEFSTWIRDRLREL